MCERVRERGGMFCTVLCGWLKVQPIGVVSEVIPPPLDGVSDERPEFRLPERQGELWGWLATG